MTLVEKTEALKVLNTIVGNHSLSSELRRNAEKKIEEIINSIEIIDPNAVTTISDGSNRCLDPGFIKNVNGGKIDY
jgi:hypothetical protein